jgi:flagellar motility protein MotE (MotC chaperone)
MPVLRFPQSFTIGALAAALIASPASAQDGRAPEKQRPKPAAEKPVAETVADSDASRYCAAVAPSIAEARIAWQTKRLTELDAQVKQRIADMEKAEASERAWIANREAMMSAANDDLVAIFAKMDPEAAAKELTAMDDKTAAAILGKLKPNAAGSILAEMEPQVASRLVGMLSAATAEQKKS